MQNPALANYATATLLASSKGLGCSLDIVAWLTPYVRARSACVAPSHSVTAWTCGVRASEGGACLAKRAQPTDGRGIDGVGLCDIGQGFARIEPLESFLPLVGCQLRRTAKLHSTGLRAFPASPVRARISSRSNSAKPPSTVSMSRPCGVVVSAHVSFSDW